MPGRCGTWRGVCNRLRMWATNGIWERVFTALMSQADAGRVVTGVRDDEDVRVPRLPLPRRDQSLDGFVQLPGGDGGGVGRAHHPYSVVCVG
nr:hypothetical protein [Streptomyces sp. Ncost-T10-10d]